MSGGEIISVRPTPQDSGLVSQRQFTKAESTSKVYIGKSWDKVSGYVQLGSKGHVDHCLGVNHVGCCWYQSHWYGLAGVVSVPTVG